MGHQTAAVWGSHQSSSQAAVPNEATVLYTPAAGAARQLAAITMAAVQFLHVF